MMQKIYTCFIVDDDEIDRLTTQSFCRRYPFLHIAGVFTEPSAALEAATKSPPDILFLDIDMEGMSGLELRSRLEHIPACIFITSYPDYAVESFEKAALDFLVKPLKADRFAKAMERLEQYLSVRHKAEMLDHTLGADTIFIKDGHDQVKILLHEIMYLEALKDYTGIITAGKKYCVLSTLGSLLEQQAFRTFVRIHRSYAVQKNFIERVTSKEVVINNIVLPLGRTYKDSLDFLTTG
jgi:two-component system, LytTR family, response regulator